MRDFKKLKELSDYSKLDAPVEIPASGGTGIMHPDVCLAPDFQTILRMLVRPKYSNEARIPEELRWLTGAINWAHLVDKELTGIKDSFCYVTVRRGKLFPTDDEWHFDGSSFRTDLIPERNYIWVDHSPTEYKTGELAFPDDFDPVKHHLFKYADSHLRDAEVKFTKPETWYMLSPFCLHRRPYIKDGTHRTFIRICFTDIEGRDINNTPNPLLETDAYGRDPVRTFRDELIEYGS